MEKERALTPDHLRRLLHYDPEAGVFHWKSPRARCLSPGDKAGNKHPRGYVRIKIGRWSYQAHRLAWLYVHGRWPADEIDHRNGKRDDNRIANLRECSRGENNQNTSRYCSNSSGIHGVTWHKATNRWRARIAAGGKQRHLGLFHSAEDAQAAYLAAKAELHRFQPRPRYA